MKYRFHFLLVIFLALIITSCKKDSSETPAEISSPGLTVTQVLFTGKNKIEVASGISETGNSLITSRGFCWSKNANPTIDSNVLFSALSAQTFSDTIKGLTYNTKYYIRAFATNASGTSYGGQAIAQTEQTSFLIGQNFGGGQVFYIDSTGEHGLIAAKPIGRFQWAVHPYNYSSAGQTFPAIGSGKQNTKTIIASGNNNINTAAMRCDTLVLNGYDDWFLPSYNELLFFRLSPVASVFNGYPGDLYWSSTQALNFSAFLAPVNAISSFNSDDKIFYWGVIPMRNF